MNGPDGGDGGAVAPATALEACQQLNEAEAQLHARCYGGAIDDWRTVATTTNGLDCARYARHVSEGLVEYRPDGWAACLAKYAAPCAQANPYPCYYEILHGLVPDGQPCEDTDVCGTVSGCLDPGGGACGGVCAQLGVENQACGVYCGTTSPCLDFALCASGLTCVDGVCVRQKQAGEVCGGPQAITCRFGSGCDVDPADPDGNGTCVSLAAGRACRSDGGCLPTEFCLAGTCTPRRAAGASCADAPTGCGGFTACDDASQTCVPAGHVAQPCASWPGAQFQSCVTGFCDGLTCQPLAPIGAGCAETVCETGATCDPATVTCRACGS